MNNYPIYIEPNSQSVSNKKLKDERHNNKKIWVLSSKRSHVLFPKPLKYKLLPSSLIFWILLWQVRPHRCLYHRWRHTWKGMYRPKSKQDQKVPVYPRGKILHYRCLQNPSGTLSASMYIQLPFLQFDRMENCTHFSVRI